MLYLLAPTTMKLGLEVDPFDKAYIQVALNKSTLLAEIETTVRLFHGHCTQGWVHNCKQSRSVWTLEIGACVYCNRENPFLTARIDAIMKAFAKREAPTPDVNNNNNNEEELNPTKRTKHEL
jgi:hypothetical protein